MTGHLLEAESITKQFARVTAVDGLSFGVRRGEIFALLGPNGAGKTTTVRMLLDVIRPDSGTIRYFLSGEAPSPPAPHEIGYLPEDRGLYREIRVEETLAFMGVLRGMRRDRALAAARSWLERVGLEDRARDKLDSLSKGNQQKVQFIASLLHAPLFLILDEPFSGLDPVNQEAFLEIIRGLRDGGTTVLLSSHQMNLVERLADRVLLMNRGRRVLEGTIPEIKKRAQAGRKVILTVDGGADPSVLARSFSGGTFERLPDGEIAFMLKEGESISDFLSVVSSKFKIASIRSEEVSLHEVFVRSVGADDDAASGAVGP